MKVASFCAPCKAKRFYDVTCLSTKDGGLRKKTMGAVLANIRKAMETNDCPSFAGTVQSEIIRRMTGNRDPFRKQKLEAIGRAKRIFPEFERWVLNGKSDYERFRRAVKLAVAGNALELSAPNYSVDMGKLRSEMKRLLKSISVDDTKKLFENVRKGKDVLYLCDNCGEAVFDVLLIQEINRYAPVTIAVASEPMDEDVSLEEMNCLGLDKLAPVIGKGRTYGVWKKRAPWRFWKRLEKAGLIVAKGMGNYETLDEYKRIAKGRTAFLLVVKCPVVEANLGIPRGSLVVRMV